LYQKWYNEFYFLGNVKKNMRSEYIENSVLSLVIAKMGYENALAVRLSLESGLRIGDVLKVRREDFDGNNLHFVAQKTNKKGVVSLSPDFVKELLNNSGGSDYIFCGRGGDKPRTRQAVYIDFKKAVKELGIKENATPHSVRKIFAVEELKNKTFEQVQEELQHSNADVTMLYACADKLNGLKNTTKKQKNDEKTRLNAILTPKTCENCIFEIGLDNFADIVANKVIRAIFDRNEKLQEEQKKTLLEP
jgi:integrase